ncbi:cysteine proteinase [Stipitochalara longipes BDJ]|nr:cysteine proteinase [Stipitochalara longipes BDJ]
MDEHFRVSQEGASLQRMRIEQGDIESMRPGGWLTDNCIREVIARFGNFKTSRVNIVDPTWLNQWIQFGGHIPEITPVFFKPHHGVTTVQGLAIPFNEGNSHWSALYVDLEHCGAIYFNTLSNMEREQNARNLMQYFYSTFREFFQEKGQTRFRFVVDEKSPNQGDGCSCGIYVAAAVVDLLAMARPRTERLTAEQIKIFRENGVKWLAEAPKVWDWLNRDSPFKLKLKKEVHWDPSIP